MGVTRANKPRGMLAMAVSVCLLSLLNSVQAMHFYAKKNQWTCFKDMLASNYTLEMEVIVLDKRVLQTLIDANDALEARGKPPNQGVRLMLMDQNEK